MKYFKYLPYLALILALLYGFKANTVKDQFQKMKTMAEIIRLVNDNYVDDVDMDNILEGQSLLVRDSELLYEHIVDRVNNEHSLNTIEIIRKRFFGGNKDGAQWIVEQL